MFSVSLYRNSDEKRVRKVYAGQKGFKDGIYYDYPLAAITGTDDRLLLKDSKMPDLVYDGYNPDTFKDQWRKCYYDDYNFTATFNGGRYTYDVNPYDEDGNLYEEIEAGDYTVLIEVTTKEGETIGLDLIGITIAINEDKIMSRFSPDEQFQNVMEFAEETGYTVYVDDFPGLFYDVPFLVGYPHEMRIWIDRKWHFMNAMEYENGRSHFLIYNVSSTSATWKVELGTIENQQAVDNPDRLVCYYYDVGDLEIGGIKGKIVPFAPGDRLYVYRADFQTGASRDNFVKLSDLRTVESDFNLLDGLSANVGDVISLYGVVKPIQASPADIVYDVNQSQYEINNRISTVEYTFISEGGALYTSTRDLGLVRDFGDGNESTSLLEYKHDFEIQSTWADKTIVVVMQAYDIHGNSIAGTFGAFIMTVDSAAWQNAA